MTYAKGSSIDTADYNNFAGLTATAAPSAAVAQQKAGYLWGVGFGDRGYGGTVPNLTAVSTGNVVGQEWQNLRTTLSNLASWQGTSTTLLPPSSSFNAGQSIVAHEQSAPSLNAYDIQDMLVLLDNNRLNYQVGNMTLTSSAASSTRGATWGSSGNPDIDVVFEVTFASENAARYFFNSGGEIRIALNHPSTLTPRDQSWNTVLSGLQVAFRANTTVKLGGAYGTAVSLGYYGLTTTEQLILNGQNTGISPYGVNDFYIYARATSIAGVNGARGSVLQFRVLLVDEQTNAFSDTVQGGTSATLSHLRATGAITVASPTVTVPNAF